MSTVARQFGSSSAVKWYPETGSTWELLWENEDPTSAFAAQTISLDLSSYTWVKVEAVFSNNAENATILMDAFIEDNGPMILLQMINRMLISIGSGAMYVYSRIFYAKTTGVEFYACSRRQLNTTSASSNTTSNDRMIPTRIWAIK